MWRRYLLICLLVSAVYWACLALLFPGYFAPFVPHHSDMYIPAGLLSRDAAEVAIFPRPLANLFLRGIGIFGVQGSIAAVVLLVLGGVVLHVGLLPNATLAGATLFSLILFAHPQFYFQHRHDVPAALSFVFLLLLVWFARKWITGGSRLDLILAVLATLAMGLTKETYYMSALVLVAGLPMMRPGFDKRRWLSALAAITSLEIACLVYNSLRYTHYLGEATGTGASYSPNLNPLSVLPTLWSYLRELASLPAFALIVMALLAIRSDRRQVKVGLLFVVAGIASLLPNAALPNHMEAHYAWVAAPLLFVPLLSIPIRSFAVWIVVGLLAPMWLWSNRATYSSESQQWHVRQEQGNGRILAAMSTIRREEASHILVSGLKLSYHPWLSTDFVKHYFGNSRQWTLVVSTDGPKHPNFPVRMLDAAHASSIAADVAVLFREDGELEKVVRDPVLSEEILVPALRPHLARLRNGPNDFTSQLGAGVEYLHSGWTDKAIIHLERALAVNPSNPYPYFFLGLAAEANGNTAEARDYYLKAIAKDGVPPNLAFRQALLKHSR